MLLLTVRFIVFLSIFWIVFILRPDFGIIHDVFPEPVQIVFIPNNLVMIISLPEFSNFVQSIFLDVSKIFNNAS